MEQHTQSLATSAGFQGSLPPSLLSVALQNGGAATRPGGLDPATGELLPPSLLLGDPSQFSDYVALANALLAHEQATAAPSVVMVDRLDFQEFGVADQPSSLPFNASDLNRLQLTPVASTVQNTRITTELSTAITNFINNISDAISQLITDLQAAIDANPAVALLLLLPLLFLPFLFNFHGGGHGGGYSGGYGHRRVYYPPSARALLAESLAERILADIEDYRTLFSPDDASHEPGLGRPA